MSDIFHTLTYTSLILQCDRAITYDLLYQYNNDQLHGANKCTDVQCILISLYHHRDWSANFESQ